MNRPSDTFAPREEVFIVEYANGEFLVMLEGATSGINSIISFENRQQPLQTALAKLGFKRKVVDGRIVGYATGDPMVAAAVENGAYSFLELTPAAEAALNSQQQLVAMSHSTTAEVKIPKNNEGLSLRPYQAAGVNFIRGTWSRDVNVLNTDDVGLGKTAQALISTMFEASGRVLIVCPANVKFNWAKEIRRWWSCEGSPIAKRSPLTQTGWIADMNLVEILDGFKAPKKSSMVVIAGYANFSRANAAQKIYDQSWDIVILDEAHYIKNQDSNRSILVRKLKARKKLAITATPMEKPQDMYPLLQFLDATPTYADFLSAYGNDGKSAQRINDSIRGRLMIGRKKSEVAQDLPPLLIDVKFIEPSTDLEIHPAVKAHAATMERELAEATSRWEAMAASMGRESHDTIRNEFNKLMARAGRIPGLSPEDIVEQRKAAAMEKLEYVVENCLQMVAGGDQVVIGYHHKVVGTALMKEIAKELGDAAIGVIDGAVSSEGRELVREALDNKQIKVILASITAASTGINLQAANNIIMAEVDWSGANMFQFYGRIHRIGQQNNCYVLIPVLAGTIEQHIMSIQGHKSVVMDIIKD